MCQTLGWGDRGEELSPSSELSPSQCMVFSGGRGGAIDARVQWSRQIGPIYAAFLRIRCRAERPEAA